MSRVYRALEKAEKEKEEQSGIEKQEQELSLRVVQEETPSRVEIPSRKKERLFKSRWERREKRSLLSEEQPQILLVPPESFSFEQFRKLKTQIFHWSPGVPHIILVTSAAPDEGKTMVSFNLAVAIAQEIDKKVILVDADLRKPEIQPEAKKGLSNYLLDHVPLSEILVRDESKNMLVIPAGPAAHNAVELIGSNRMAELFKSLREYGTETYVVIDSPPILATAEPTLLSKMVDGVILVVTADRTLRESVRRAVQSIGRERIIGVVLNQVEMKSTRDYSGYYSGTK